MESGLLSDLVKMFQGWVKIPDAAQYSGVSTRTFRKWLAAGLKHARLPSGTVLVQISDINEYLEQYSQDKITDTAVDKIANQVLRDLKNSNRLMPKEKGS